MASSKKRISLAIIGLITLLVALWWRSQDGTEAATARVTGQTHRESDGQAAPAGRRTAKPRPVLAKAGEADPESREAIHFRNFYLRPVSLQNADPFAGIPLAEAVARVKAEYFKTATATKEATLPLTIDLSEANTTKLAIFRTPRGPLTSILRLLVAASGNRLTGTGPDFRFTALDDSQRSDTTLTLSPSALSGLTSFFSFDLAEALSFDRTELPMDPGDLTSALKMLGIQLSPELSILLENNGAGEKTALLKNATAADLETLRAAINLLDGPGMLTQQKLTTKALSIPAGSPYFSNLESGPMSDGQIQMLLRNASSMQGSELSAFPSVVARTGQTARIEMMGMKNPQDPALQDDYRVNYVSAPIGTGSEHMIDYTKDTHKIAPTGETARTAQNTFSSSVIAAQGMSEVTVTRKDDGSLLLYIHGAERIDATGRPVNAGMDAVE